MGRLTVAVSVFTGLILMLSACTQESDTDIESATKLSETSPTLRIAAAANLSDVLPDIIKGYQADKALDDQSIDVTYASSGKLYTQIKAGAPYDIYLSANQEFPAKLAKEKASQVNGSNDTTYQLFTYTQGQLALYSVSKPLDKIYTASLSDVLMNDDNAKITIANPELAPYGTSAKAYLQSQHIYEFLSQKKRIIQAENISQAFQYAHTASVDYGFVAQSQLVAIKAEPEQFMTLKPDTYPAILQDGIVISDSNRAVDFSDYLRSAVGQQYFSQAGYLSVQ
ncbi:MAG: molybdate ABC transporter substrate-binding protein [Psychrobacter sp.]|uniref:molybdate ABC transporter substrate-binding protein n=1 Tax=unclassified Psychrobacter TaxID=196806 RepID=UPI0017880A5A|nr:MULTISPECIES: molybdate ABC transporter substrate-binding protein [unclassified Psychrobacter]MBE0441643.1 molybdate ABC transporter substrate-binding protein [Psychrobacter sp. FME13]